MQRYKLAGCAAVFLLALSSTSRGDNEILGPVSEQDPRIAKLLARLSDPDPSNRGDACQRLINLGEAARPTLRRALPTASPQTRAEIDRVLLHVPWIRPGDNGLVEQAFRGYADLDAEQRCNAIDTFWSPGQTAPVSALLRIVLNDPCTAVRWQAAGAIISLEEDDALSKELVDLATGAEPAPQAYVSPAQNAPLLALAGWALQKTPARCQELLEKSLALETDHPSAFRGQMDFVFNWLCDRAETQHQHARLIQLLREQANRTPCNDEKVPEAVSDLFAAQADFGPDAGFTDDLRTYREYFTNPEMIYTISRLAARRNHPVLAEILADLALSLNGTSLGDHFRAGRFLAQHEWNLAAEREFKLCLHLPGGNISDVYFNLSALADERTDDLASAQYLEIGLTKLINSGGMHQVDRFGRETPWSPDAAWAEVWWHYLRAAQQSHDVPAIQANLDKLLGTDNGAKVLTETPGMAADIVPALQNLKRNDLADTLFDAAHAALLAKVNGDPQAPGPKNNLAWLCACTGKNLDEAARLAGEAVALAPDEGAYLDTQAEVFMRMGQPARAAEIEARAIQAKPEDVYMAKQLERFRTAAARQTH
jgi:hypothetical protein